MADIFVTRKQATTFIEDIRLLLAQQQNGRLTVHELPTMLMNRLEGIKVPELTECQGEAHSNPFIDNCSSCAPRWGVCGPKVVVR